MTSEQERIARVETRQEDLERRLAALESNQRWGVLMILGLFVQAVFDFLPGVLK